jgi:hypothetical protein
MDSYKNMMRKVQNEVDRLDQQKIMGEADTYRSALEKAAYGDAGRNYGQGLGQITNYLARSGPLADSGAATALRYKLASSVYGGAQNRIQGGYAEYLRQLLQQRRQFEYQKQLMDYQKKLNKKGPLDYLAGAAGGIAGFALGGPPGAAAGYGLGSSLGGSQSADNYANYGYG